ncbi:MAG: class I SAM-dependent methyltransferase [Planctomycetota bacterium]
MPAPDAISGVHRGIKPEVVDYISSPGIAHRYDRDHDDFPLFELDLSLVQDIAAALPPPPPDRPKTALDLGCGTGRLMVPLARLGFRAIGIDLSPHMLALAREKLDEAGLDERSARLFRADITDLFFLDDASVDLAVCLYSTFGLISGRDNRLACLRGIRRVLRPGGRLLVHVHNRYQGLPAWPHVRWLLESWRASRRGVGEYGDCWFDDYLGLIPRMYIHSFSAGELRRLLRDAGFASADVLCVNRARTAVLTRGWFRWWRANGFFGVGVRPSSS